jgi:hypothetical protein
MSVSEVAQASAATPADRTPVVGGSRSRRTTVVGAVAGLTLLGAVVRLVVAHQALFADELSTYWISATHGLGGVMSLMYGTGAIKHAEITPPMYFVAAWAATRLGHTALLLRAPSLIAGVLTIPLVYQLGLRSVGRRAALMACAVTTLSPFMIYYSTEARAYAILMLLVSGSTLSLLLALDTRRTRWWVVYAICTAGVIYTHYTGVFVLAAQLVWVLVFHAEARRPAILANLGAFVLVIPWLPGLINDYRSPTTEILSALSPFTPHVVWIVLTHWALGYPYAKLPGLPAVPGSSGVSGLTGVFPWPAIALIGLGAVVALVSLIRREPAWRASVARGDARWLLVIGLALATPVGEAIESLLSTHIFGIRNLAASWPALALAFSALLVYAGGRRSTVAVSLALVGFAIAAASMLTGAHTRPHYQQAAEYVDHTAKGGDVVIDETGILSPGPVTALDLTLHRPLPIVRALAPQERDHPFGLLDPHVSLPGASAQAARLAGGHDVFVVGGDGTDPSLRLLGYRRVAFRDYRGVMVAMFSRATPGS